MATKSTMHLLQQKLAKSTTRWNDKKLRRGLSGMVIIHQLGTVDLAYNKGGVTGLSASINTLKLASSRTGQIWWQLECQLRHTLEKRRLQNQGSALSSFHTREQLQRAGPHTTMGPCRNTRTLQTPNSKGNVGQIRQPQNCKLATDKTKA